MDSLACSYYKGPFKSFYHCVGVQHSLEATQVSCVSTVCIEHLRFLAFKYSLFNHVSLHGSFQRRKEGGMHWYITICANSCNRRTGSRCGSQINFARLSPGDSEIY